ncbi:MAG: UDP-N-acetylmuramoyl-tripeptide--D-alanyl-D-alanine ligase [Planctomycetota bacterium]
MIVRDWDELRSVMRGTWVQRPGDAIVPDRVTTDSRVDQIDALFFALAGERFDGHEYVADVALRSPSGIVIHHNVDASDIPANIAIIRVDDTRLALARLARHHRRQLPTTRVIAITGTAGKTTTKTLLHTVLSQTMQGSCAPASFNNDIGVPLTILHARAGDQYLIVEVGTNAPGEIATLADIAEPDISVVTLIGRGHLEGLGTIEDVAIEKMALIRALGDRGTAIMHADSPGWQPHIRPDMQLVRYGRDEDAELTLTDRQWTRDDGWVEINERERFPCRLPGEHNAMNTLATIAIARRLGMTDDAIRAGLHTVTPAPMRAEIIEQNSLRIINDAYNANPESMHAALAMLPEIRTPAQRCIVVLGDMLELGDQTSDCHGQLGREIAMQQQGGYVHAVMLIGPALRAALPYIDAPRDHTTFHADALNDDARATLRRWLRPGDLILLKGSRGIGLDALLDDLHPEPSALNV